MSSKIKICYILPFYDEGTDTHLFYNYELIKKLAALSAEAPLSGTKAGRLVDIFVIVEKTNVTDFTDREKVSCALGAPCYIQKFSFAPLRFLELFWKCFILRVSGYRNFYVHYSYYGALAAWFATRFVKGQNLTDENRRRGRAPESARVGISDFQMQSSGPKVFYWNRGMPWLFKKRWLEERIFQFILRHTILVTGPESLAKEYARRYGVKNYRILSNWVDVARFAPKSKFQNSNSKIVLFVHHLSRRKGADLVLEIAKGFGEGVLFLMIGEGPEFENLKLKIENSKLNNVRLLGRVPNSEIVKYFWASDVFLMPSREEGSPHVLLEAMASGTPFVASDVGGVRELLSKPLEELLCPVGDTHCFQAKIRKLLNDQEFYNRMKAECLSNVKNFDISKGVREFIDLLR